MRVCDGLTFMLVGLLSTLPMAIRVDAQTQQTPKVRIPNPGVPQIMTLQGSYVRVAYNNEGYVIIGYRLANESIGHEWMLLEVGMTVRDGIPEYRLVPEAISLETPDGKTLPLPSLTEYRKASEVRALQQRGKVQRDSINYFPPDAHRACRIGFFTDLNDRALPWDDVELSSDRACLGRLYFQVPGGIAYGQHWLNVKFQQSLVRVPFRILTDEEEKLLSKNLDDIKQQVDDAFRKKD